MREILYSLGDVAFTKLDKSNVEEFKQFYSARLKDENTSLYLDYDILKKTIDNDLSNGSTTFLAYRGEMLIGSLKCDDSKHHISEISHSWNVNLHKLYQHGGLCYMGRYGIDKMYMTNASVNQGLFLLAVMYAIRRNNCFLLTEAVPKSVRTYRRLGFYPVLFGDEPYIWLEVAKLCPMINNMIHFILSNDERNKGIGIQDMLPKDVKDKIAEFSRNEVLMSLYNESLIKYTGEDVSVLS